MKIKWKIESREVPGVGLLETGQEKEVSDPIGMALVRQNQADEVVEKIAKKTPRKEEE